MLPVSKLKSIASLSSIWAWMSSSIIVVVSSELSESVAIGDEGITRGDLSTINGAEVVVYDYKYYIIKSRPDLFILAHSVDDAQKLLDEHSTTLDLSETAAAIKNKPGNTIGSFVYWIER